MNAKSSTTVTVIPKAMETGHCTLKSKSVADRIVTDNRGRVTRVSYFDERGAATHSFQEADLVIVSANAGESARLLLNSSNRFFPAGLANSSARASRQERHVPYQGPIRLGFSNESSPHDHGPGPCIAINDFIGGLGGAHVYNFYVHHPIGFSANRPPGSGPMRTAHKEFQRKYFRRYLHLNSDVQDMPVETVSL